MKRNRKTAAVLAGFIMMALMMVSCNESNSYRELTKQEIQSAFLTVRGYHTGKMVYLKNIGNYQTKTDTLDISWTIDTDSTLTIHNFAVEPFAEFITDNELKEALLQQPAREVYVLAVHEERFVKSPGLLQSLFRGKHKCSCVREL